MLLELKCLRTLELAKNIYLLSTVHYTKPIASLHLVNLSRQEARCSFTAETTLMFYVNELFNAITWDSLGFESTRLEENRSVVVSIH